MKSHNILLSTAIAVTALFFIGCSKNNSSSSSSAINFQLQTANRSSVIARVDAGNIQWTSGFGSATEIKFEAKMNGNEVEQKSQTIQKLDLFSAISTLGNVTLTPGTYSEVEFKVELNPAGTDAAMELTGQYTSAGVTTPVVFRVTDALELKNEKNNVVVTDNSTYKAITTIDLSLITTGITQAMLNSAVKTNGTILISAAINSNIYNILLINLHDSDEVEFEHD
ncbi:MAG TPA: hypothetical protein VIM07_15475 [Chitinophagaceae bacterium]